MLNSFSKSFEALKLKTKIQLYILPILVVYLGIYVFENFYKNDDISNKYIINDKNKSFDNPTLEPSYKIEKIAKKLKIRTKSLKIKDKKIELKGELSLSKFRKFIYEVEKLNSFTNFQMLKLINIGKQKYEFEMIVSLEKYFVKIKKREKLRKIKKQTFTLKAIVAQYVMINKKWYKQGDFIGKYKISKIGVDSVLLKSKEKSLLLELKDDKYSKYIN